MITRIEIDGFKSFRDFAVDLAPFTVLMGANAAGKSNLLDALSFARAVALNGADQALLDPPRAVAADLFHHGAGRRPISERLTITVGLILESPEGPLAARLRVRCLRSAEGGPVLDRSGTAVWVSALRDRAWMRRAGFSESQERRFEEAREAFLARTGADYLPLGPVGILVVASGGEGSPADEAAWGPLFPPGESSKFELARLVAREVESWTALALQPEEMRRESAVSDRRRLVPSGANLAAVLHRLGASAMAGLRADVISLIPGALDVRTVEDERRATYDFDVLFDETGWTPPRLLSDGTLRVVALLAASRDPAAGGLLAVEEVENGLHPQHVVELVRRLRRSMGPSRQLLLTSHSPVVLAAHGDDPSALVLFMDRVDRTTTAPDGSRAVSTVSKARPLRSEGERGSYVTAREVAAYLATARRVVS